MYMKKLILIWLLIFCILASGCYRLVDPSERPNEWGDAADGEQGPSDAEEQEQPPKNETPGTDAEQEQPTQESTDKKLLRFLRSRPCYQLGINALLEGNIQIHLFLMDDDESQWDEESMEEFMQKNLAPALDFLEGEAKRYGVSLDFSVKPYATVLSEGYDVTYNGIIKKGGDGSHTLDLHERAAHILGYENRVELFEDLYRKNDHQEVILLFAVNKDGVSYAWHQAEGSIYYPTVEFATVFSNHLGKDFDPDEITHTAASVAHEILHLYGAEDLYAPQERKDMIRDIYPEDIMLMDYLNIDEMSVGEYTAYAVGWKNRAPTINR